MSHDVFISYAKPDKHIADAMCHYLEQPQPGGPGIRCWIAPRDSQVGVAFGESIINAIENCKIMVVVFSDHANESKFIKNEVERAFSKGKTIIPFRTKDVQPAKALELFISAGHWLDAFTVPVEQHFERLAQTLWQLLDKEGALRPLPQPKKRQPLWVVAALVVIVTMTGAIWWNHHHNTSSPQPTISQLPTVPISLSTNASLADMAPSEGVLKPAFDPEITNYALSVPNLVAGISLTLTPADLNSPVSVRVNHRTFVPLMPGQAGQNLGLNVGTNEVEIRVAPQNKAAQSKDYFIAVTRLLATNASLSGLLLSSGDLSPAFGAATLNYAVNVPNEVTDVTLSPVAAAADATIQIQSNNKEFRTVASGNSSGSLPLQLGANTIKIKVIAPDKINSSIYTLTMTRLLSANANLAGLSVSAGDLSPGFDSTQNVYTMNLAADVSRLSVIPVACDPTAAIQTRINGGAFSVVPTGNSSGALSLQEGNNLLELKVVAQDARTVRNYFINVNRAKEVPPPPARANIPRPLPVDDSWYFNGVLTKNGPLPSDFVEMTNRFVKDSQGKIYDRKLNCTWIAPADPSEFWSSWKVAEQNSQAAGAELPTAEQLASLLTREATTISDLNPIYINTRFFSSHYTGIHQGVRIWIARTRHKLVDDTGLFVDICARKPGIESHGDEYGNVFFIQPGNTTVPTWTNQLEADPVKK